MLFMIDEQNKKGGLLGKQLEAVVVDPASDWPLFAEKARELLTVQEVDVIFGCWTSVSRKSVLPVIEELNDYYFTQFNMKVKKVPRMFSILEQHLTNKQHQLLIII